MCELEEVEDEVVADLSRLAKPIMSTVDEDAEFSLPCRLISDRNLKKADTIENLSTVMKIDLF